MTNIYYQNSRKEYFEGRCYAILCRPRDLGQCTVLWDVFKKTIKDHFSSLGSHRAISLAYINVFCNSFFRVYDFPPTMYK